MKSVGLGVKEKSTLDQLHKWQTEKQKVRFSYEYTVYIYDYIEAAY